MTQEATVMNAGRRRERADVAPPAPLVAPFTVVIDSREQHAYMFAGILPDAAQQRRRRRAEGSPQAVALTIPIVRRGIPTGDYSIDGYDGSTHLTDGLRGLVAAPAGVAVERKSIFDLYGTLGQCRARFTRELERLNQFQVAAVVVEAEWSDILTAPMRGIVQSQLNPKTIFRSVLAWQQRFPRVHWMFCPGRAFAEVTTFRILERFWRDRLRLAASRAVATGDKPNEH